MLVDAKVLFSDDCHLPLRLSIVVGHGSVQRVRSPNVPPPLTRSPSTLPTLCRPLGKGRRCKCHLRRFGNTNDLSSLDLDLRTVGDAFVAEMKTIFEPWQLAEYLATARQTEPIDPDIYEGGRHRIHRDGTTRRSPPPICCWSSVPRSGYWRTGTGSAQSTWGGEPRKSSTDSTYTAVAFFAICCIVSWDGSQDHERNTVITSDDNLLELYRSRQFTSDGTYSSSQAPGPHYSRRWAVTEG